MQLQHLLECLVLVPLLEHSDRDIQLSVISFLKSAFVSLIFVVGRGMGSHGAEMSNQGKSQFSQK